ncbi:alkaline phosphatase family protein [Halosimplex amylolyticum]|uniref:alkaline phosphatase family protein n=1 Tax=Halosimplex amylolyticum TaxID=3396616 RepID=UPI003F55BE86
MNVIVVGLDGLEPSLVERWAEDLPTLRGLMEEGSFGRVRSADPPLSAPAWPWIFTGKQGGKHGCFGFTKRRDGEYSWDPVNYGDVNAESLWEALDDAGVSCGVANVPLTYPPADLDHGYVVSGWPVPNRVEVSNPPEVLDAVEDELGERYRVHPFDMGPELQQASDERVLENITDGLWHHQRAFETLTRQTDVDVFCCVFMATDVAGHYLGRDHDLLKELYVEQDRALRELLDGCPSDVDAIVMSDHGHAAASDWNFYVNEWLREEGYLSVTDPSGVDLRGLLRTAGVTRERLVRAKRALGLDDVRERLPQPVFEALQRVVPPADERSDGFDPGRVEWSETVAYSPDQNVVHLNTADTHPEGTVSEAEASRLRAEIESELGEIDHPAPDRDDPLMTEIRRKEEVFDGPFADAAPDVIPIADEMHVTVQTSFNDGDLFARDEWSEHRQFGALFTAGDSFARTDDVRDRSILDLFPLVLDLIDEPVPEDVDGEVPAERLAYDPDPSMRESHDEHAPSRDYTEEESEDVREQLKGLGYLE